MPENHLIRVLAGASEQRWPLTASRRGRDWLITITSPDGTSWAAEGPDLFKALRALRRVLDPLGVRLGVNGARRDAWASGMQCDMGEGRVVYLLAEGQAGRPEQVSTLGDTPVSHVGTVDDQDQQYERWLHSRQTPTDQRSTKRVMTGRRDAVWRMCSRHAETRGGAILTLWLTTQHGIGPSTTR